MLPYNGQTPTGMIQAESRTLHSEIHQLNTLLK